MVMNWDKLLNQDKVRESTIEKSPNDGRNEFEGDYSRLIFSSPIRRLQDKAQVFPLDNSDYIRTRLTHSMEVSSIARSLGSSVEQKLIEENNKFTFVKGKISALLATVGLAHDIGNPPFGHFGESVIQNFFKKWFENNKKEASRLTSEEIADFTNFEGNSQSFRLLTKLHYLIDEYGYNLTYGTLASILKYPRNSLEGNKSKDERISYHKFGYFQSEKTIFEKIKKHTGIGDFRHPLTFLLEAADDIAYSAADIEDGYKKNVIDYEIIRNVLGEKLNINKEKQKELFESLEKYKNDMPNNYPGDKYELVLQRFRIKAQGYMISSVVDTFLNKHKQLLSGSFDEDIILSSDAKELREALKELAVNYIFKDKAIITKELVGEKVICGLLEMFVEAVVSERRKQTKTKEGKLYQLISPNYRFICERFPSRKEENGDPSLYDRLLLVTDFICGMTDTYALKLYQKLTGIEL